jgi:hypothetical protein
MRYVPVEYSYIPTLFFNPTDYVASNGEDDCEKCERKHILQSYQHYLEKIRKAIKHVKTVGS